MNKRQRPDEVIKELWAVKDSTAEQYSTVGGYLSHLRQSITSKKNGTAARTNNAPSVKLRPIAARRKAMG